MLHLGPSAARLSRGLPCRATTLSARHTYVSVLLSAQKRGLSLRSQSGASCCISYTSGVRVVDDDNRDSAFSNWARSSGTSCKSFSGRRGLTAGTAIDVSLHSIRPRALGSLASSRRHSSSSASNAEAGSGSTSSADASAQAGEAGQDALTAAATRSEEVRAMADNAPLTFEWSLYTLPKLAMAAIDGLHTSTGMPYWVTIVAITMALRTAIVPVGVLSGRNAARTALMKPEMDQLQAAMEADQQSSQQKRAERYRQETRALYKKYDCSLALNAAMPLVQLPLFMSFFLGLRSMPETFPGFASGGAFWFQDLSAADPYMIFPLTAGLTTLALAELGGEGMSTAFGSTKMRAGMRAMSVLIVPLTMNISTGVFLYWTTSNIYSIAQTLILKEPSVKRYFNIPDAPKAPTKISDAAKKEIGWLDVFGADNPLEEYKKMNVRRASEQWLVERGSPISSAVRGERGPLRREGAPLPPPPPMVGEPKKSRPAAAAAPVQRPRPQKQEPQVVTYATRPNRNSQGGSEGGAKKGRGAVRGVDGAARKTRSRQP